MEGKGGERASLLWLILFDLDADDAIVLVRCRLSIVSEEEEWREETAELVLVKFYNQSYLKSKC